jgi:transposase
VVVRLRWHQPTKDYLARRRAEGRSKRESIRCLKRYVAREVYALLRPLHAADPIAGSPGPG